MKTKFDPAKRNAFNKSIGHHLKHLRKSAGLTRHEAAKVLQSLSVAELSRYERGLESPPGQTFALMVKAYDGSWSEADSVIMDASKLLRN